MKLTKLLAATILVAFGATFASCSKNATGTKTAADSTSVGNASNVAYTGKIAFIRMDSLMNGYGLYIDLSDDYRKKGQGIEAELTQKGRALEREVAAYQEKAQKGLVTRFEQQSIEEGLQKKNQAAMQYRDKMTAELQQEEMVMSNKISEAVMSFIKEYNAEKGYSMIIQTTGNTPILIADPALDITSEVLVELNKRYLESKGTAKKIETKEPAVKESKK